MRRFQFEIANASDDGGLRALLRATPTDGRIRLTFCREPSYFDAAVVEGSQHQTILCRDMHDGGRIVGMGSRSTRLCWVQDRIERVGYLSGLRIDPQYRGAGLLAHGYRLLAQLHEQDPLPIYLTTIAEGNERAWRLLTSRRAGLPEYDYACDYLSMAMPLSSKADPVELPLRKAAYLVQRALDDDLDDLIAFWGRHGRSRVFFPAYRAADFDDDGMMRGLRTTDVLVARCGGQVVGTFAIWDQMNFRQSIVQGYDSSLRRMRPLVNAWARLRNRAGLPDLGQPLALLFAALPVVNNEHLDCFPILLRTAKRLCSGGRHSHLVLGMSEHDPMRAVLPRWVGTAYRTRLCFVRWTDEPYPTTINRQNPPYLEVGSL